MWCYICTQVRMFVKIFEYTYDRYVQIVRIMCGFLANADLWSLQSLIPPPESNHGPSTPPNSHLL